ncbi:MAG: toll/interleukin-1 receptor domain-containing protein [Candidatus Thiodiazotropha sp. (ex Lucinoma borealis)]|nr:toll/interleukin-1 receptor domain-containing protein [Candidatus Thiodiazotropha sp. (ex Lucinoma borealis)]
MKVFISWSGELSHKVAVALRDWLPSVIQTITPYVSSEDIDKGARWSSDIASELDQSAFGILCVTKDNVFAPWLNFEAGALGKSIDKSKVCPFLFRIKRSEVEGPILQYQSTIYDKEDTFKLLKSVNDACNSDGISEQQLEKAFEVWWPQLAKSLDEIVITEETAKEETSSGDTSPDDYFSGILEELLELSRTNQKLLRDPESILPRNYFDYLFERHSDRMEPHMGSRQGRIHVELDAFEAMVSRYRELIRFVSKEKKQCEHDPAFIEELSDLIRRVDDPLRYMTKKLGKRLPRDLIDDFDEDL